MNFTNTIKSNITAQNVSETLRYSSEREVSSESPKWSSVSIIGGNIIGIVVLIVIICVGIRCRSKRNIDNSETRAETINIEGESKDSEKDNEGNVTDPKEITAEKPTVPDLPERPLDWHKIFRFLAKNIHAVSWRIFFNCLYGNTTLPTNLNWTQTIDRIVIDKGSHGTEYLLLEQFQTWKEAAGKNASPDVITNSLIEMGHMDTLEIVKTYMSDPPYLDARFVSTETNDETLLCNGEVPSVSVLIPFPYQQIMGRKNIVFINLDAIPLSTTTEDQSGDNTPLKTFEESETDPKLVLQPPDGMN